MDNFAEGGWGGLSLPARINLLTPGAGQIVVGGADGNPASQLISTAMIAPKGHLRQFHAALAQAATAPVDIVCIGDSETVGFRATAKGINGTRWVDVLRNVLRASYQPSGIIGGEGYIKGDDTRWTTVTTTVMNTYGLGRAGILMSGADSASITVTCTDLDILWAGGPGVGSFSWKIDGGAATTVSGTQATLTSGNVTQVRGLSAGSHTLALAPVSGGIIIEGVMVYNGDAAAGIRIREGGHTSYKSGDFVNLASNAGAEWVQAVSPGDIDPDLVIIALGANDYFYGVSPDVMAANLTTLLADVRAQCTVVPSIVFVAQPDRADAGFNPTTPWSAYIEAIANVAIADGKSSVCNLNDRFWTGMLPPWDTRIGLLNNTDHAHPTDAGYWLWAHALADFVTP